MNELPLTLDAPDGHRITGTIFTSANPVAILVISHGMAEHGDRYRSLAQWLSESGMAVVTFHHRGHGPHCPWEKRGHYADRDGWANVIDDLHQVVEFSRSRFAGLPLHLLGHSMGSFIAQSYAQEYGDTLDSLILSATNRISRRQLLASRGMIGLIRLVFGKQHRSRLVARMTFEQFNRTFSPNRTGSDWLSRDHAQVDQYVSDPFCGFDCTVGLWWDFIGGMLSISPSTWRKDLPVHLFSGTADAVGEMGRGVRQHFQAIREAGLDKVTLRLFDGGRHEMLNETNREEVWGYLRAMCLTSDSPLQAGYREESTQTHAIID
ncbi:lysophospholipase [Marinobacter sp. BW6]|uniref:alpha/beta fold hydrolase n=1 Tax=Marinobacter sp. BW6 TaxID=2592624 RepID=UPI0011DEEB7B|nr:alpha/beta fold hydrolase [Marinobacter sp. BW6]TYC58231.1 lysophospholipase [Marinobacter sp. BW6]